MPSQRKRDSDSSSTKRPGKTCKRCKKNAIQARGPVGKGPERNPSKERRAASKAAVQPQRCAKAPINPLLEAAYRAFLEMRRPQLGVLLH